MTSDREDDAGEDRSKVRHLVDRALGFVRARVCLRGARLGAHVWSGGRVVLRAEGDVLIEDRVSFVGGIVPTEIRCARGALVSIGEGSVLNYGVSLHAARAVRVGRRCMLASMVHVADRAGDRVAPVEIEDDVWIAHGAIVEPGVTIGRGSVVSAGSVVTSSVPAGSLAVGNPARCMSLRLVAADVH